MKIAIPVFQTKISPRFDSTQDFILLQIEQSNVMKRDTLHTGGWSLSAKINQLVLLGVDTLICGGIDLASMQQLNFNGIKIYSWITGEVEDAVTCFLNQGLESGIILGTDGRRKDRWRFCTKRNHFCNMAHPGFNPKREGEDNAQGRWNGASGKGFRCWKRLRQCQSRPKRKGIRQAKGPGNRAVPVQRRWKQP